MEAPRSLTSPVRTGNLVLKTRIALVIRNLQDVQKALTTVQERRAYFRRVLMFPERVEASIDEIEAAYQYAIFSHRTNKLDEFHKALKTLSGGLDELRDEVNDLKGQVGELRRAVRLDDVDRTTAVHWSLRNAVSAEFGDNLANLETLRDTINAVGREGEAGADAMRAAWTQYSDRLYKSSERLFEEYVDLFSGVALRDTGFDRGIARLAEDLLKPGERIGNYNSNTLTIPAREEALAVTAARIVRLGFPEWTIWTLPLTAYELGSNYADSDMMVARAIHELGGDQDELFVLVADAFATYFLGPAYACAALLMRLNPAEAFCGNRLVAKRAAIILSALMEMSREGVQDHYAEITSRLAVEWADALRQTGWDGPADGGEAADADDTGTRPELRRLTGLTAGEQEAIDKLLEKFMPLAGVWILLEPENWPKVEEWAEKLRHRKGLLASDLGDLAQLRYVLNAAWRARIAVLPSETDVDDPQELKEIARAVEDLLWILVREPKATTMARDTGNERAPLQLLPYTSGRAQPGRESA